MKRHILIYGGTISSEEVSRFIEDLSYALLDVEDIVLVTGGFIEKTGKLSAVSTDVLVLQGATRYAKDHNKVPGEILQAWIPDPNDDKEKGVRRFLKEENGATIKILTEQSSQLRRLEMVNNVDIIVAVDAAARSNKIPAFPLPIIDGTSKTYWGKKEEEIKKEFGLSDKFAHQLNNLKIETLPGAEKDIVIKKIAKAIHNKINRRCLVLLEIDSKQDPFYDGLIKPLLKAKNYEAILIHEQANKGNILETFKQRLKIVIGSLADVTEANPNVMYELGYLNALGKKAILISKQKLDSRVGKDLPFYLKMDTVEEADATSDEGKAFLIKRIEKQLDEKRKNKDFIGYYF